jgi:hypothetical protein
MKPDVDQDRDPLIDAVAAELKKPVPVGTDLSTRVRAQIRHQGGRTRRPGHLLTGLAVAAGLIAVAVLGAPWKSGTERVEFVLNAPQASRVTLVGDFNNWDPQATPLVQVASTGRWRAVLPLPPGRYQYTFVVDGTRWVADPGVPQATGDDFGRPSSVITVVKAARS